MQKAISTLDFFDTELKGTIFMARLTKYEKETILITRKGDKEYSIYTSNQVLRRKLNWFSKAYPKLCKITDQTEEGNKNYDIEKIRVSIRVVAPSLKKMKDFMKNVLLDYLKS